MKGKIKRLHIHSIQINGKFYFNVNDAFYKLGYSNIKDAVSYIEEKDRFKIEVLSSGKKSLIYATNVSGLYNLILHSNLTIADMIGDCDIHMTFSDMMSKESKSAITVNKVDIILNFEPIYKNENSETCKRNISDKLSNITEIASEYGMSARLLNKFLNMKGIQHIKGNKWVIYNKYSQKGYIGKKPNSSYLYWTSKGRHFIENLLEENGYHKLK